MSYIQKEGRFVVTRVVKQGIRKTDSGKWFVDLTLDTPDGLAIWNGYLTEKTMEKTLSVIAGLGFTGDTLGDINSDRYTFAVPVGTTVTIKPEIYEGKTYYKAAYINFAQKADVDGLKEFLAENKLNEKLANILAKKRDASQIPF